MEMNKYYRDAANRLVGRKLNHSLWRECADYHCDNYVLAFCVHTFIKIQQTTFTTR